MTIVADSKIIAHVKQLIAVVLLVSVSVVAMVLWQVYEQRKTEDLDKNFYSASLQYVSELNNEILLVKTRLIVGKGVDESGSVSKQLLLANSQSLHVINDSAKKLSAIQNNYKIAEFILLIDRLERELAPFRLILEGEPAADAAEHNVTIYNVEAVILTLSQMNRLYKIASEDLLSDASSAIDLRITFMLCFLLVTSVFSGLIARKAFSSIKEILKHQHDTEQRLFKEKELIGTTLYSIGDAVITTDSVGNIATMNPVAERLTGWTAVESKGLPIKDVFPIIDASTRETITNPVEKVLSTGETVFLSNHTTLISKDGTEYQIADSAAPIRTGNGPLLGMVLVFNDITEQYKLRESAAKNKRDLQAILDNSPSLVYVKDIAGNFVFINKPLSNLLNISNENIEGRNADEAFSLHDVDEMKRNESLVLSSELPQEFEEVFTYANETRSYISVKFPLFDDANQAYAICSISTDVTDRIKQAEQLQRSQKMDAIGKLTGGVAHDYNNMLSVILGYAELLKESLVDQPELANYAHEIYHASERGAKLTKKLLSFSRHKSSTSCKVEINTLLNEQQHMLERTLTARIKLTFELAHDLWLVWSDNSELEDTVLNLCINALHAMDNASGLLTIQTRNEIVSEADAQILQIESGDYVSLSVSDTGCGMTDETIKNIFDPYFTTKGELGTGLGLSQVYGFVTRSGGTIKVYSEINHGSRFTLYFPRYHESAKNKQVVSDDAVFDSSGDEKILVVDDEPSLLNLGSTILRKRGYGVVSASCGAEALEILEREHIDLLLTDIIMPEMDGYQLTAVVQKKYPKMKILLASGFTDNRNVDNIDSEIQNNILRKPYYADVMLKKVRKLLDT